MTCALSCWAVQVLEYKGLIWILKKSIPDYQYIESSRLQYQEPSDRFQGLESGTTGCEWLLGGAGCRDAKMFEIGDCEEYMTRSSDPVEFEWKLRG